MQTKIGLKKENRAKNMKISAKARYGLAAMLYMGHRPDRNEKITIVELSENLGISKIFLEQVFAELRRSGLVKSTKGAQGGYSLEKNPKETTAYEILSAIETGIFEKTDSTLPDVNGTIEKTRSSYFSGIDSALKSFLEKTSLWELCENAKEETFMYYI
jgi:Rrf2 family protein